MTRDLYATVAEAATLLHEGQRFRQIRLQAADMVSVIEASALIDVDTSTIAAWISSERCIGVADLDGTVKLPRWQFEPSAWPAIELIGHSLGTHDPWQILAFLETPVPTLDGLTPRVALERGVAISRILNTAIGESY